MKIKSSFYVLLVLCTILLLGGCSAPQVKIDLSSTAALNMNQDHEPLPVVVNVYQLSDKKAFENASFGELWKSDLTVLSNSLLRKDTLTLDPASQQKLVLQKNDQARYVGIMAAFRQQPDDSWKIIKKIDRSFLWMDLSTTVTALLNEHHIEVKN